MFINGDVNVIFFCVYITKTVSLELVHCHSSPLLLPSLSSFSFFPRESERKFRRALMASSSQKLITVCLAVLVVLALTATIFRNNEVSHSRFLYLYLNFFLRHNSVSFLASLSVFSSPASFFKSPFKLHSPFLQ